jgi:hypothetical protein
MLPIRAVTSTRSCGRVALSRIRIFSCFLVAFSVVGCDAGDPAGRTGGARGGNGGSGGMSGAAAGTTDGGMLPNLPAPPGVTPGCGDCPSTARCRYESCVPDLGDCATNHDCPGDSYCDDQGECIPYGVPPTVANDPECRRPDIPGTVEPAVQCEWTGPAAGEPGPQLTRIYTTPMVADFDLDGDPGTIRPSIVVTTFDWATERRGALRLFDGRTCALQLTVGADSEADEPGYGTQWAVADLDGDVGKGGRPEIVGYHRTPGASGTHPPLELYAIRLEVNSGVVSHQVLWYGRDCAAGTPVRFSGNLAVDGPGIWDLDDDGRPEIVVDEMVFDADGCLKNPGATHEPYIILGIFNTVADVDHDGKAELVRYDRVAEWTGSAWVDEPYFQPSDPTALKPGNVAVADLGDFTDVERPAPPGPDMEPVEPEARPEVIVVSALGAASGSAGEVRVQGLDGNILWGPVPLQGSGRGGPPTASDFDGDGEVEFAAAGGEFYNVFDLDCAAAPLPERPKGKCDRGAAMAGLPDGILWAQPSQDLSSNATGSSVFDFDGDGSAEAVYRDECYLRVYEGSSGNVRFSAQATNGTGYEFPTIADVDGDFATEIVVPRTDMVETCPAADPLSPASASIGGTTGFVVLRDPEDRWVNSRPIWNQHAYSITHISDDGVVPRTSLMKRNWEEERMNNFRQNYQPGKALELADLTIVLEDPSGLCDGQGGRQVLEARVCNRGTDNVVDGVSVDFIESEDRDAAFVDGSIPGGAVVCSAKTTQFLMPGSCEVVKCDATLEGRGNVYVIVDPKREIADCTPENNEGASALQLCVQ